MSNKEEVSRGYQDYGSGRGNIAEVLYDLYRNNHYVANANGEYTIE